MSAAIESFDNPAILSSLVINAPIYIDCRTSVCPEKPIGKDVLSALLKERNNNDGSTGGGETDETSSQQQQNGADDSFEEGGGEKGLVFLRGTVVKNDQQGECMDVNAFVSDGETTLLKGVSYRRIFRR